MASLANTKLVRTGDEGLDYRITQGFYVLILICIWDVAGVFRHAYRDATTSVGRKGRGSLLRKPQICLFLMLAIVALFIVNGIKFQHLKFKIASWKEIAALLNQVRDTPDFRRSSWFRANRPNPEEVPSSYVQDFLDLATTDLRSISELFHQPDEYIDRLGRKAISYIARWRAYVIIDKAIPDPVEFQKSLRDLYNRMYRARQNDSIWHNFRLLVIDYRRCWWTQQWFMGYMSWAVFMAIECM